MKRGDIYVVNLPEEDDGSHRQHGDRPAIIVSNDKLNGDARWESILVVPLTKSDRQRHRGSSIFLSKGTGNIAMDSWALCHQILLMNKSDLLTLIGSMPPKEMHEVEVGLKVALYLV